MRKVSEKKQHQIDKFLKSPFKVGERVDLPNNMVSKYSTSENMVSCTILEINGEELLIIEGDGSLKNREKVKISMKSPKIKRWLYDVGVNPFNKKDDVVRSVNFTLESILSNLDVLKERSEGKDKYTINEKLIRELNWNPFIFDKDGKKQFYQRDFVWTDNDKRLLIDSLYNNVDCGKVLVRRRSWEELRKLEKEGETDLAFYDLVDGKQRLNAIRGFIEEEFQDSYGNYYSDLSYQAQFKLVNNQLISYSELPENSKDEDIVHQFLKLNFTGVPQSKEHIDFVKSLNI